MTIPHILSYKNICRTIDTINLNRVKFLACCEVLDQFINLTGVVNTIYDFIYRPHLLEHFDDYIFSCQFDNDFLTKIETKYDDIISLENRNVGSLDYVYDTNIPFNTHLNNIITLNEVLYVFNRLKIRKAPEDDHVINELIKLGGSPGKSFC